MPLLTAGARFAQLVSLAVLGAACYGSSPGLTPTAGDGGGDASADAGAGDVTLPLADAGDASHHPPYAVCPDAMAPSFSSLFARMLSTRSCGVTAQFDCHSTSGALPRAQGGTGSLLDFSLDAATVYTELLGDGGGYPSTNVQGDAGRIVLRVAPGDADASMLYIKLALPTETDPRYGLAMPPTGLVCPTALDAVKAWIDDGGAAN
jgi:hypothetical protein